MRFFIDTVKNHPPQVQRTLRQSFTCGGLHWETDVGSFGYRDLAESFL